MKLLLNITQYNNDDGILLRIVIIVFPHYWYIDTRICISRQSYKYLLRIPLPAESIIKNCYSSELHSISVFVVVASDRWPLWNFHHSGTNKLSERRRTFVFILMNQRWLVRLAVSTSACVVLSVLFSWRMFVVVVIFLNQHCAHSAFKLWSTTKRLLNAVMLLQGYSNDLCRYWELVCAAAGNVEHAHY